MQMKIYSTLIKSLVLGILNIDLNNIILDNNIDEDDPDTIILIRLLVWLIKFENAKSLKKISMENQSLKREDSS